MCYFTTSVIQVGVLIGFFKGIVVPDLNASLVIVFKPSLFTNLLQGFGMGLVGTQTPVIINQYFVKYRATATGIALAGGTLGSFVFPPLVKYIITEYSLRGCFLILGGIMLNTIPVALLLRPPVPKVQNILSVPAQQQVFTVSLQKEDPNHRDKMLALAYIGNHKQEVDGCRRIKRISEFMSSFVEAVLSNARLIRSLLANPLFLVLCCTQISFTWGWTTYVMVVVDFAVDKGIDISVAVTFLSAFAGADLCGRLGSGWISDKGLVKRKNVARASILMIGVLLLSLPHFTTFGTLFTVSLFLGLFSGSIMILFSILLVEYVGIEKMPVALGTSTFTCGMATMLRPAVIGFFRDAHDSYDGLFTFLAALCIFSASLWAIEPCISFWKRDDSPKKVGNV